MCGGDGGGGEFVFVCVYEGVHLRFKVLYVQEVDTVTPVQYMQFDIKTPKLP